jgi:redox-sensitive bicupin YhaK (pirin superfamily)
VSGSLAHQDSMGNGTSIPPGDVQRMSAGRGVRHSEFNHAADATTHFFQIWIEPHTAGIAPGYEQKTFADVDKQGRMRLVVSPDGAEGSVTAHADARIYATLLDGAEKASLPLDPRRKAWVQLVRGTLSVNGVALQTGDAALLADEVLLTLDQATNAEALVFDLAA